METKGRPARVLAAWRAEALGFQEEAEGFEDVGLIVRDQDPGFGVAGHRWGGADGSEGQDAKI